MSETTADYDFAVIGGGSAGYAAARTAVAEGLKTVVIDGSETLGGLCILRGCMPSKALIESGNRNLVLRRAGEFGLHAQVGQPDIKAIRDRKRVLIDDFAGYRQKQLQDGRFDLIRGQASFESSTSLKVRLRDGGEQTIRFRAACIATGSKVSSLPVPGLAEAGFWTSDDVLDAESLPDSLVVLGGGAIALEMTHYLEAMGCKVTLIQRSARLLSFMDAECGDTVAKAYEERGIAVHCGTKLTRVEVTPAGKAVTFVQAGKEHTITAAQILLATGRSPALDALQLNEVGVDLSDGKIKTSATMQTSCPHVFAAGDVVDSLDVVHIAIQEAEVAAKNAAALLKQRPLPARIDYRLTLFGVFSDPQVAAVGRNEAELNAAEIPFLSASYPFNDHGKSMIMGVKEGFVKMLAHQDTGEILGASVVGPEATELIHELVIAMHYRSTVKDFMSIPHYHPTLSEIWTYPAEEIAEQMG
jgi:pyruvate/2-oxoglutarate dehydrogenase complex dihydrolipoamide dehydrogenase (E3) component